MTDEEIDALDVELLSDEEIEEIEQKLKTMFSPDELDALFNPVEEIEEIREEDIVHYEPSDKHKKFTNSQGKQHGEAGNSFSYFECLSSSTSNNCPVRKLGKKEVAKGVADCQRDSNSSRQSSKSSKRIMSGNNASVPPGFPPKCNRVNIEDSDEEDKLTVKELLRSCNINNGVVNRISGDGKPLSDAKSHVLSSLTTESSWNKDLVDKRTDIMLDIIWNRVSKWIFREDL